MDFGGLEGSVLCLVACLCPEAFLSTYYHHVIFVVGNMLPCNIVVVVMWVRVMSMQQAHCVLLILWFILLYKLKLPVNN